MTDDRIMGLYNRAPISVASGKGVWLTDEDGRVYLDCVAGIATNGLGHCHPALPLRGLPPGFQLDQHGFTLQA